VINTPSPQFSILYPPSSPNSPSSILAAHASVHPFSINAWSASNRHRLSRRKRSEVINALPAILHPLSSILAQFCILHPRLILHPLSSILAAHGFCLLHRSPAKGGTPSAPFLILSLRPETVAGAASAVEQPVCALTSVGRDERQCSFAATLGAVRSRTRGARRDGPIQRSSSLGVGLYRAGVVGFLGAAGKSPARCLSTASFWA
jgi:hypothetical protein